MSRKRGSAWLKLIIEHVKDLQIVAITKMDKFLKSVFPKLKRGQTWATSGFVTLTPSPMT